MKKLHRVNLHGWRKWQQHKYRWPPAKRNLIKGWVWHEVPESGAIVKRKILREVLDGWGIMFGWVVKLDPPVELYNGVLAERALLIEEDRRKFLLYLPKKSGMDADPLLKPYFGNPNKKEK